MGITQFHVHVDATELDPAVERSLQVDFGFEVTDFCGHIPGLPHFEPDHHLTLKCEDGAEYRRRFAETVSFLSSSRMRGYLEGEYVASDVDLEARPFQPSAKLDFRLALRRLPPGQFRSSEIHITMDRDRSDPRLIQILAEGGFFAAYLPKSYGTAVVLTAQGDRATIGELMPMVHRFLANAGGAVTCSVMEERVVGWWASDDSVELPPVVAAIDRI